MAKTGQQLKIGFVLDGGLERPDGVQQYILSLGEYFSSLGHEVRHIVAGEVPSNIKNAYSFGKAIGVNSNGNRLKIPLFSSGRKIRSFLSEEKFDVLHIQTPYSPMMGERFVFKAGKNVAVIGTYHIIPYNFILSVGNKLLGAWCHFSLKRFDKMLSVSSAAQKVCLSDFRVKSEVLPNVIDFNKFYATKPAAKNESKVRILFLGRLVPRKGCMTLLEAINSMDNVKDRIEVVICGQGPLEGKLKKFVADNDLGSIVTFKGFISEESKPAMLASADISVFPASGGESFGIVLLEAMASGKAVVLAGNNAGYASVMSPKPELLFDHSDPKSLAQKIDYYLNNESKRREDAKWCSDYARGFDVKVVGDKLLDIYRFYVYKRNQDV
ncbi:MAG TPA: glycosyltransferase family 4 protein [Candidatus Sulfotelmatobacter sp.]|nr:glycosyltransferase family 4 protein [Candidatus Sulfotelmatobacter sp.]